MSLLDGCSDLVKQQLVNRGATFEDKKRLEEERRAREAEERRIAAEAAKTEQQRQQEKALKNLGKKYTGELKSFVTKSMDEDEDVSLRLSSLGAIRATADPDFLPSLSGAPASGSTAASSPPAPLSIPPTTVSAEEIEAAVAIDSIFLSSDTSCPVCEKTIQQLLDTGNLEATGIPLEGKEEKRVTQADLKVHVDKCLDEYYVGETDLWRSRSTELRASGAHFVPDCDGSGDFFLDDEEALWAEMEEWGEEDGSYAEALTDSVVRSMEEQLAVAGQEGTAADGSGRRSKVLSTLKAYLGFHKNPFGALSRSLERSSDELRCSWDPWAEGTDGSDEDTDDPDQVRRHHAGGKAALGSATPDDTDLRESKELDFHLLDDVPDVWEVDNRKLMPGSMPRPANPVVLDEGTDLLQAFLPPWEEMEALSLLNDMQARAVKHVALHSKALSKTSYSSVVKKIKRLGYTTAQFRRALLYVRDEAPIIIHFYHNLIPLFNKDPFYRNQFETGTSNGSKNLDSRKGWENRLFDNIYKDAANTDRPKYGCFNIFNNPKGVSLCNYYGDSYMVMKKVRLRTTFCDKDSCNSDAKQSCCEYFVHVMNSFNDNELRSLMDVANLKVAFADWSGASYYKEVQYHGPLDMREHVEAVVVPDSFDPKSADNKKYTEITGVPIYRFSEYETLVRERFEERKAELAGALAAEAAAEEPPEDHNPYDV